MAMQCWWKLCGLSFLAVVALIAKSASADEFEQSPIEYSKSTPDNCISQLQAKLDQGEAKLAFTEEQGYLAALLDALKVPVESQMLVFSQTSLQRHRISPRTPRAIYFSDEVYIGYCQKGDVLEISAVDPQLGAVFYTLDQKSEESPRFVRQTDSCLLCHSSSRTEGVPGHTVRSLFADSGGQPIFSAGSNTVDHTTPLEKRWGGWYVTGTHGEQTHLGNLIIRGKEVPQPVDNTQGQNLTQLPSRCDASKYLAPHSDIVALMVLEHQTLLHNRLTRANYAVRQALHYQTEFNKSLGEPAWNRLESTGRRIESAGNDLVDALLLVDEAQLTAPLVGTSCFAEKFPQQGPRDSRGRSLRDFDLKQRLFRYPCSYLIYSPAFDALHPEMRAYVWQRLWDVLVKSVDAEKFSHLTADDRQAIVEIIRETKTGLPDYWKPVSP
jgi:hypothetical protein